MSTLRPMPPPPIDTSPPSPESPSAFHSSTTQPTSGGPNPETTEEEEARTKKTTTATAKKKKAARTGRHVTPNNYDASQLRRIDVDRNVVDELLLVCGVIGTTTTEGDEIVPVSDCLNWLQDLQRALRRDDDLHRPISLLLGQWKVVQHKLLPLVLHSRYDTTLVLTVCKILVILTKPLCDNTVRAGKMVIDTRSQSATDRYVRACVCWRRRRRHPAVPFPSMRPIHTYSLTFSYFCFSFVVTAPTITFLLQPTRTQVSSRNR
jgi:Timeless protein